MIFDPYHYHRHSSKMLMKGIFDPYELWPFDHRPMLGTQAATKNYSWNWLWLFFFSDYSMMPLSPHTPAQNSASRRGSSSLDGGGGNQDQGGLGANVSYHYLGGRDQGDPLSNMTVARSGRGWHCPECIHIATTKGNLKSHILSGRHKLAEKLFKCRFCDRSYATKQSMQVHISTNHRQERDSM